MSNITFKDLLAPYSKSYSAIMLVFSGIIAYYNLILGGIALLISLFVYLYNRRTEKSKKQMLKEYIGAITDEIDDTIRYSVVNNPLPLCMMNQEGELLWFNDKFSNIFEHAEILSTDISLLVKKDYREFFSEDTLEKGVLVPYEGKTYRVMISFAGSNQEKKKNVLMYWTDVTSLEILKGLYKDERLCFAYVSVDNYDDLIASSPDDRKSIIAAQIEKVIRQWAAKISATVTRYKGNRYFIGFEYKYYEKLEQGKFSILDEVREIETDADFPVSLSIGIGIGGKTPVQQEEYASAALDLALGRGGDQAVVKRMSKVDYFGGRLQTVEKRNKGKSRIMAHALRQLIDQSSRVVIMGHKKPDMDCLGAALGVYRIAKNRNKESYIVLNTWDDSLEETYQKAQATGNYKFVTSEAAIALTDKDTLVVIVDTHRPGLVECREILGKTDKLMVIDHHRKTEDNIDNATLTYMEAYASSTSELITEILQYVGDKKEIDKLEAEALLAGITVDTKSFSVKTGVRTFEAASWLRRSGADTTNVKQLFRIDMESYQKKAGIIAAAKIINGGFALSRCDDVHLNVHIINSQAADELLNIKGVRASFVVGVNDDGVTVISARSLGDINVQIIMEQLGGGGHLTMAGAQVELSIDETLKKLEEILSEMDIK